MSQNRRPDDVDNGSRRNKESEHKSTTVSAFRRLEQEEVLGSEQHVIATIVETLVASHISQLEHGNLGSQTNNNGSEDGSRLVSTCMKVIESRTFQQSIKPVLKDLIREVAKGVIETEVKKILTRNSGIETHSLTKNLELRFCDNISVLVYTGFTIKGKGDKTLELALYDSETGQIVDSGPKASTKFEVFLLSGDLEQNTVEECKGKNSPLKGNTNLKLNKGICSLGDISFKHRSKWTKTCKLRLGARIVDPLIGTRVKEAKTDPFTIKDKRNILYEKHDCPSPSDKVCRLKNIYRRGAFHQRLSEKGIETVDQLLIEFNLNPQGLQKILGSSMSGNMLQETVANAMKRKLDDGILQYSPSSQQAYGVPFNDVGQLLGVHSKCAYVHVDQQPEQGKEVSYLAKNSLSCDSFDLSNVLCPSDLHRPESIGGHNSGNYHMINETDSTQPHNSLPNIVSSNNPTLVGPNNGSFNMTDGCDSNWAHTNIIQPHSSDPDIIEQHTSFMGSTCNSSMGPFYEFPYLGYQTGSMCNSLMSPFDEFPLLDYHIGSMCNSLMGPLNSSESPNLDYFGDQGNNPGMETSADQQSAVCASVIMSAQSVAVGKVPSRWMRASAVLIVELIKRSVKSNDPKRQRCS